MNRKQRIAVVGAVADVVAKDPVGGLPVALGSGDSREVQSGGVLVRSGEQGCLGGASGQFKVAGV